MSTIVEYLVHVGQKTYEEIAHHHYIAKSPAVQVLFNRISFQQVLCEFDLKPKAGKKNITL